MDAQKAIVVEYNFSKQFTRFPGGRFRRDGEHSGQQFYEDVLLKLWNEKGERIVLNLSNVEGFATSFLDGAFGEFAAQHGEAVFYKTFDIRCDDDPTLADEIRDCVLRADRKSRG
ncbi:MAG: DUF4325 domain-containing protein [Armatimonadetes bacterium]|nr:MAG: DUF4325 domain-containing protein [Armatimonadota bacterium]